jgi:signal transduction histidine kinase/DNA-binding NarL/FixJ family response regulator
MGNNILSSTNLNAPSEDDDLHQDVAFIPTLAIITNVEHSFAIIKLPGNRVASLPWNEVWYNFKLHDKIEDFKVIEENYNGNIIVRAIQDDTKISESKRTIKDNDTLLVVPFGRAFKEINGESRLLYSHIRAYYNPWNEVKKWKNKEVKSFIVEIVTKDWAFGTIEPGVRSRISLKDIKDILPEEKWHGHQNPLPRDEIAGWFIKEEINYEDQIVTLDFINFIKSEFTLGDLSLTNKIEKEFLPKLDVIDSEIPFFPKLKDSLIKTIFLLDDDDMFSKSLSDYLEMSYGINTLVCRDKETALKTILEHGADIDLAILDVNLNSEEGRNDHEGIQVAYFLRERYSKCPIVLTTGQEIDPSHPEILRMVSLTIHGILYKPFGIDSLHKVLTVIAVPPVPLSNFFQKHHDNADYADEICDYDIQSTLNELREASSAKIAVLFKLDPITDTVTTTEAMGASKQEIYSFRERLAWSPVRDAAIYGEIVFTKDIRPGIEYPKHRYLFKVFNYKSCMGVPVYMKMRSYFVYSLFIFSPEVNHFKFEQSLELLKRTSKEIELLTRIKSYQDEIRLMKPFELMGQAYGSLAHDLSKNLSADFMLDIIDKQINSGNLDEAKQTIQFAKERVLNAQQIVQSFRDMARGQNNDIERFFVYKAIKEIVSSIRMNMKISIELSSNIDPEITIIMRRAHLTQLLINIILNASQQIERLPKSFLRKGQILVQLTVEIDDIGINWLLILVHDNGPGIHRRDFNKVFDMHYTTKEHGCGMGLDICKTVSESVVFGKLKGSIRVKRSILLSGSSFEVRLPLINGEE